MQDSTGYIWLGTKDGINRCNGTEFTKFADSVDSSNNTLINVLKLYPSQYLDSYYRRALSFQYSI